LEIGRRFLANRLEVVIPTASPRALAVIGD
jgi:hypothetical protein